MSLSVRQRAAGVLWMLAAVLAIAALAWHAGHPVSPGHGTWTHLVRLVYQFMSPGEGGDYIVGATDNGTLVVTNISLAAYLAHLESPVRTRTVVQSSGAFVLDVTVEVIRHARERSWNIFSDGTQSDLFTGSPIVLDLQGTGVLEPTDAPGPRIVNNCFLSQVREAFYWASSCVVFVFPHNATLIIRREAGVNVTGDPTKLHSHVLPVYPDVIEGIYSYETYVNALMHWFV